MKKEILIRLIYLYSYNVLINILICFIRIYFILILIKWYGHLDKLYSFHITHFFKTQFQIHIYIYIVYFATKDLALYKTVNATMLD